LGRLSKCVHAKALRTSIWGLAALIDKEVSLYNYSNLILDKKHTDIKAVAIILADAKQKLNRLILP